MGVSERKGQNILHAMLCSPLQLLGRSFSLLLIDAGKKAFHCNVIS